MFGFWIGLIIGFFLGMLVMALAGAASRGERALERFHRAKTKKERQDHATL